jgi:hypothetical protein
MLLRFANYYYIPVRTVRVSLFIFPGAIGIVSLSLAPPLSVFHFTVPYRQWIVRSGT